MIIYVCGDSTAASYTPEQAPITGWGQVLGEFLPGVRVENRAMAGRSTKSFLSEGRLQKIETEIQEGDLLLIQFTHNDISDLVWRHTDPWTGFSRNLEIYVDTARLYGAKPVLMTPICCRAWQEGQLMGSHGDYPEVIRGLAWRKSVPLSTSMRKARLTSGSWGRRKAGSCTCMWSPACIPPIPMAPWTTPTRREPGRRPMPA